MGDSALALFCMGALLGMILSIFILALARTIEEKKEKNEEFNSRKCDDNSDIYVYILKRDWYRRGNN